MKVGVARETAPGEARVALVPDALAKLTAAGLEVLVEKGAGTGALIPDSAFTDAGAKIVATDDLYAQSDVVLRVQKPSADEAKRLRKGQAVIGLLQPLLDPKLMATLADAGAKVVSADDLYAQSDVVLRVQKPSADEAKRLRKGQAVIGLLQPLLDPKLMATLADAGVTAISLDAIPRTLSRAQTMDALSSQANVGGYKAVVLAANAFGRYFPLLTTAAGTAKPANLLVLGIGVAGLQAIGTARRLGAVVKAYDVRPETREQAESLGAQFVTLKTQIDATGAGGYARELTPEERAAQQAELNEVIGGMDVVITTAQVPGRKPPVLVTASAVGKMKPGSVIVDMAASALGGNCELSKAGETVVTDNLVTILAPENLPASMPIGSSQFYARNISALLLQLVKDGQLNVDPEDEIGGPVTITHGGEIRSDAVKKLLAPAEAKA